MYKLDYGMSARAPTATTLDEDLQSILNVNQNVDFCFIDVNAGGFFGELCLNMFVIVICVFLVRAALVIRRLPDGSIKHVILDLNKHAHFLLRLF